ncbi:plasmid mobilization relaxosome protein MobC [Salmonella enterica subsp. enterica]|uniref:MobC family plasmid mobilization relaxosome protein n=2 Tax=Salmonella enterica TaxID=28901 RepID=A0A759SIE9_SALER|nr:MULTISPECIES: plasmid mobilization relaxosome protein MobC [Serratia]EAA4071618.1 plasmid mobilization relaxosome protein MobC [Salmonella enterica subsp. enterica serovar Napoli]EAC0523147.1 plasmid mobilization relaxosome protein MobC [Salmonella enterica subsp. enterica serovar Zaiman]EAU6666609.1 plasmid mobilization relaxosome protein MobC [Salmonella enterica]ECY4824817.1 MobC family plasmid mobilization relaxosome protein [Salmonella enterica subsp. enterica serovar Lindern]ECY807571
MPTTDRKRGRINLSADERRDISIQFRVNKAEFEYLKELVESSGLERGHYIRREILKSEPVVRRKMPEVNQKTYIQLSSLGNNINQAAKKLNSNEYFDKGEVDKLNFNIKQVGRRILEINKDLNYEGIRSEVR